MAMDDDPAALYRAHYGALVAIATTEFGIPEAQAEWLADVVLVSILKHIDQLTDPRTWLVVSMRYAAHRYNKIEKRNDGCGTARIPFATRRSGTLNN